MGVPATTVRVTPVGIKLGDGYTCRIAFAADPDVSFWEKTVQPPGLDGGDPVDTTTMYNAQVRTMASRALITMTPLQITAAYDPKVYDQILALVNVEGAITILFPDDATLDFFGFLQKFEPEALKEGEQPTANITVVPTNTDPTDGSEAVPNYKTGSGTD